ncbi:MAG: hypothetical protein ACYC4H_11160, partial [Desulfocucumaceae bacterium]
VSGIKAYFIAQNGWQKPLRLFLKPFDFSIQLVPGKNMLNKVNILIRHKILSKPADEGKQVLNNEIVIT